MMNRAIILGRLGQDPELKYTQNKTPVCNFSVCTTEKRKTDNGWLEDTEWHKIVVWGKSAENCKKFINKGSIVFIEGKIKTRTWDKTDGTKGYSTEIHAINTQFVSSNKEIKEPEPLGEVPF